MSFLTRLNTPEMLLDLLHVGSSRLPKLGKISGQNKPVNLSEHGQSGHLYSRWKRQREIFYGKSGRWIRVGHKLDSPWEPARSIRFYSGCTENFRPAAALDGFYFYGLHDTGDWVVFVVENVKANFEYRSNVFYLFYFSSCRGTKLSMSEAFSEFLI